jgi:hypothetical protein
VYLCQMQMEKTRELVSKAIHSKASMDRVMYELASRITEDFARYPPLVQSILVPSFSSDSMRQQLADDFDKDRLVLAELMTARQKRGEVRDDFTPMELAHQFQRAFFGTTLLWSLDPTKPLAEALKEMATVLWSGIQAQKSSRGES